MKYKMEGVMLLDKDPHYYVLNPWLSTEDFCHALLVYQNNQEFFLKNNMIDDLKGLEHWFIHVIEPIPKRDNSLPKRNKQKRKSKSDEKGKVPERLDTEYENACSRWLSRERMKSRGYSFYCHKLARSKVYISANERKTISDKLDFLEFIMKM